MARSKTILYVEDDAVTLTAYRRCLEQTGFTVVPAPDGIQATRYLQSAEPDLILLDLMLPVFDGEDVLKFIYAAPRLCHIPVIILSTNSTGSLANEHLVKKADERLLKHDCNFQTLLHAIERVLKVADMAKGSRTRRPRACPVEAPRILSLLQLNLRGVDPTPQAARMEDNLPAALA
jgi:CheY-like chemotaxis protein